MLHWAIVFFVISVIAGVMGFWGLESSAAGVAKLLFFAFLVMAVISVVFGRRASA